MVPNLIFFFTREGWSAQPYFINFRSYTNEIENSLYASNPFKLLLSIVRGEKFYRKFLRSLLLVVWHTQSVIGHFDTFKQNFLECSDSYSKYELY